MRHHRTITLARTDWLKLQRLLRFGRKQAAVASDFATDAGERIALEARIEDFGMVEAALHPRRDSVYACPACCGLRVEWESWVEANSDEPTDGSGQETWCPTCQEHPGRLLCFSRCTDGWRGDWGRGRLFSTLRDALRAHRRPKVRATTGGAS